ncbi:alpha-L-arabinofuranosidase C-terminal domain-containing protein [Bifidobacterium oedipodis]|uniref:non-reducing end alpha-L-arabinofuranosidase n=1 Tax=Bifidobacterium oedipodis TaxID=2675322 RepID=A0A7Y0EQH7_9BIFI|nr:alpha-L-arabinofuranosidase C-terminal domain-containing protein [Bifidobacterium sp. DSM 109957]NMM94598.1 alpha-L-arabinofuranosidase [Bifidobacterium sp. DSM 109957]
MTDQLVATLDKAGVRAISTDLWGVFFEDISSSADGGLNSDLVQNGAFEYTRADSRDWSNYTAWRKLVPAGSFGAFGIRDVNPVAAENPHYARFEIGSVEGGPVGLENIGFDGMVLRAGETYHFSAWLRAVNGSAEASVTVELIGDAGQVLASADVTAPAGAWGKIETELTIPAGESQSTAQPSATNDPYAGKPQVAEQGTLRIMFPSTGTVDVDFVSCEPATTYKGLEHFRPDLVQALDELKPRFMRFPGGCITHGLGLNNMYHWDRTIGDVEHRPHNFNVWGYHQSFRIGFYEYFRLCETVGMKPLPVLPAGVSCQNTSQGPVPIAQEDMPAYIDEVLGLIDFCNADPATNKWAAKRAAMGHPEPFNLEYLGIGNEDLIDPVFENRFQQIFDAVKAAHPEIIVVGTVGPAPSGQDYEAGWAYARKAGVPIVDEHSYQSPSWWFHNLHHYDEADREGPKVYLGEYGSRDTHLINGLSEAAFMSHMELNGDVVAMASYAPLFCKNGHNSWDPDLIYFDNERVYHPYSYWVQQMFAATTADTAWPVSLEGPATLRRDLPRILGLTFTGGAHADLTDIVVTTAEGQRVELPDVHYRGNGSADTGLALEADAYTVNLTVTYHEGMWGVQMHTGDVTGPNHNVISFGRGFGIELIRDGSGYSIGGTETSMDMVRPGTVWHAEVRVSDRGEHVALFIDGKLIAEGREEAEEPRRTVTVSRDSETGATYVRIVNALGEPVQVNLQQIIDELGLEQSALVAATATVLRGDDPYAGVKGEESPTKPAAESIDLSDGVVEAPAWSFTTITVC